MKMIKEKGMIVFGNRKLLVICILAAVLIALISVVFFFRANVSFQIEDKCGKFVNLFTHTIPDSNSCRTRCVAQCNSLDHSYKKSDFTGNINACNSCICYCS